MSDSPRQPVPGQDPSSDQPREDQRIVVLTPDGMGVADAPGSGSERESAAEGERERTNPADLVEEPAKVMRIGSMIKQLLEEVRSAPLDPAGRRRLAEIHHQSLEELKDGLSPSSSTSSSGSHSRSATSRRATPSCASLRPALVGWLEGLFHGIQTALVAQQMVAQQQLQQMRALPGGPGGSYGTPPGAGHGHLHRPDATQAGHDIGPTGQYL